MYVVACGGSVILGLMVPLAANADITYLVVLRAIQGAFQGAQGPAFFTLTTKWLPESERARCFSFICAGGQFGTIVSLATSGLISYHIGWKYIFYIYGSIGVLWTALWILFVFESPANHPRISKVQNCTELICYTTHMVICQFVKAEASYIEANVRVRRTLSGRKIPPIKEVFLSPPFLALMATHTGFNWGCYVLLTGAPLFINNIHHYSITSVREIALFGIFQKKSSIISLIRMDSSALFLTWPCSSCRSL